MRAELLRATVFHTPRNPFVDDHALEIHADGGLLIRDGRIAACGDFGNVRAGHPDVTVRDLRGGFLMPGFVDTHIHFPQTRVIGGLGDSLLDWLTNNTLPEEARFADVAYARAVAEEFIRALASHGTTTALVFGAHYEEATAALFEASRGLRIVSGLTMSDRMLLPELHQSPKAAYESSKSLIKRFHLRGRLSYAITPRFALSASEEMLEVCQTLMREHPDVRFQTHINESQREVEEVLRHFPWAEDYLAVYERFNLVGRRSVLAHSVHATESELARMAASGATASHCPCSNSALGSGIFPMRRHVAAGVRMSLGTDVGGGIGFGMLKEALHAYLMQHVAEGGFPLRTPHLLYLATRAGAEALGLAEEVGDFGVGKAADFVYLRAPEKSVLEGVVQRAGDAERALAGLLALAGSESVREVRVGGEVVYEH